MPASSKKISHHFKLVLLGNASVGKSCLVVRFAKDEFYENQEPTIGAAFMTQTVELDGKGGRDGEKAQKTLIKFEIWDTAGQERYRSLAPMYYRGAAAAVIVYDVTSKESFEGARSWVQELQGLQTQDDLVIALCGNKIDLLESDYPRQVETETARAYAKEAGILFFETSARTGKNVKEVFLEIAKRLPTHKKDRPSTQGGVSLNDRNSGGAAGSQGGCCGG